MEVHIEAIGLLFMVSPSQNVGATGFLLLPCGSYDPGRNSIVSLSSCDLEIIQFLLMNYLK